MPQLLQSGRRFVNPTGQRRRPKTPSKSAGKLSHADGISTDRLRGIRQMQRAVRIYVDGVRSNRAMNGSGGVQRTDLLDQILQNRYDLLR